MPRFILSPCAADPNPHLLARLAPALRIFWRALREWSGDAAYERYLRAFHAAPGPNPVPLTAAEFYVEQLERRYSRPSRCC